MLTDLSELRVAPEATIRDCIRLISEKARRIALVLTPADVLLGVVTDGDIRRGVLRGVALDEPVTEIMNAKPITGRVSEPLQDVLSRITIGDINHIPIVDDAGRVRQVATLEDVVGGRPTNSTPVVLMAGGKGQRLLPLTRDVPKPMLPVGGIPLIEIILRRLAGQGFRRVHISVNYLADVIIDYIGDGTWLGVEVDYIHESKPLGTAGALAVLAGRIGEPFIVMNSDLLTHVDLRELAAFHGESGGMATVGVREHIVEIPFGVVEVVGSNVRAITEKPEHRSLVNAGVYMLEPGVLQLLRREEYKDMPSLLQDIMSSGDSVVAFPIHERWIDVGRPEDLNEVRTHADEWTES